MAVEILNRQRTLKVPAARLRAAVRFVCLAELGREVNVNVVVVGDRRIAELNRAFLNHGGPTDVLAFPLDGESSSGEGEAVFGEIVISAGRARQEARRRPGRTGEMELVLYAVHGMLHLCGYDDRTAAQRRRMRRRETEVLRTLAPPEKDRDVS